MNAFFLALITGI